MQLLVITFLLFQLQHVLGSISDKIHVSECKEYAGLNREERLNLNDLLLAFSSIPLPGKVPTTPGEFPHVVQLGYGNAEDEKMWACAGTLISDQYILTVATCETLAVLMRSRRRKRTFIEELVNKPIPPARIDSKVEWIRLGDKNHGLEEIKVKEIILHPDIKPLKYYNDIALLKLEHKVKFGKYVRPACLYTGADKPENDTVIVTGWGAKRFGEYFSDDQMKIQMEIYSTQMCNMTLILMDSDDGKGVSESQMCIGGYGEKKALCT
ncbi:snake [Carabus blaptoides fortunei]